MSFQINSKIVVILEGGYGIPQMCTTIECILRVMIGEFYPNSANRKHIGLKSKMSEFVTQKFLTHAETVFSHWSKYWTAITDKKSIDVFQHYQKKIVPPGIAGGHVASFTMTPDKITKKTKKLELTAYDVILHKYPELKELFPKYYGYNIDKDGTMSIVIENLTRGENYNALDLKLSSFGRERHNTLEFVHKYYFYSTGVQILNKDNEVIEQKRENSILLEEEEFTEVVKRFFNYNSQKSIEKVVNQILQFIEHLIGLIKNSSLSLEQTSLLILYNPFKNLLQLRIIDLTYIEITRNANIVSSFNGMHRYFTNFLKEVSK